MNIPLDEVIYFDAITSNPSTGAATDADSTPTFAVYEEATDTDIGVGGNLTKRTSLTGNYRGSFTLSAANGFEVGKWYSIIGSATVNSISGKAVLKNFRVVAAEAAVGIPKVDVETIKTNPVVNAGTITFPTGATIASTTNITAGTIGTVSGNVSGNVGGSVGSLVTWSSSDIANAVWDAVATAHQTVGTTGLYINLIQTRSVTTDAAVTHADYGNAMLVRSTTPANTLTVNANGNANADVLAISKDSAAADALETMLDGTGGNTLTCTINGTLTGNVSGTVATVTNLTNAPTAGDLTATMKASVNAEVLDVLNVDTFAEIGQEAPSATTTLRKMLAYLYKAFRNKKTQTATTMSLFADDGTTVDQKSTVSDDGTTFTSGEIGTGP